MHKQLEDYLNEVAKSLGSLPPARRNEEMREIRQHLLNAVVIGKEQGQSEDEAVQIAVEQFGTPQNLGKNIVSAWRRGRARERLNFWGAVACAFVLSFSLRIGESWTIPTCINHFGLMRIDPSGRVHFLPGVYLVVWSAFIASSVTQGMAIGAAFPRNAVKATPVGLTIYFALYLYLFYYFASLHPYARVEPFHGAPAMYLIVYVLIAVLFAGMGSRWRKARGERRALATIGG